MEKISSFDHVRNKKKMLKKSRRREIFYEQ